MEYGFLPTLILRPFLGRIILLDDSNHLTLFLRGALRPVRFFVSFAQPQVGQL